MTSSDIPIIDEDKVQSLPPLLITIDGPAGAGKTTVSRSLAERLGYQYLDTGALYRGIAVEADRHGISSDDDTRISQLCLNMDMRIDTGDNEFHVLVNGTDVTARLRSPRISKLASAVSAKPAVRRMLLDVQRSMGRRKQVVAEGRDMGTVVFPDADVKFFLDASLQIRAERRFSEMTDVTGLSLTRVREDIKKRDENDSTRALAPLKPAVDAILIDSSQMPAQAVVRLMLDKIIQRYR